jgi:hypothetical protein
MVLVEVGVMGVPLPNDPNEILTVTITPDSSTTYTNYAIKRLALSDSDPRRWDVEYGANVFTSGSSTAPLTTNDWKPFEEGNTTEWLSWYTDWHGLSTLQYYGLRWDEPKHIRKLEIVQSDDPLKVQRALMLQRGELDSNGTFTGEWTNVVLLNNLTGNDIVDIPVSGESTIWVLKAMHDHNEASSTMDYKPWGIKRVKMYEIDGDGTIGTYTEDLCVGGTPFSSGETPHASSKVFTNVYDNLGGTWWANQTERYKIPYLGYNFPSPKNIRRISIMHKLWNYGVAVSYSDDGNTWTRVREVQASTLIDNSSSYFTPSFHIIDVPDSGSHKYWRVESVITPSATDGIDNSGFAYWMISDLQMFERINV